MVEALYNASGLGLPIVMTVANRAIGAPINIWNDHSDTMSQRDSGWIQLYAESNQEAVDLHFQAYRLAEEVSLPVMVCMDGFVLTHAYEAVDLPAQEAVDAFLDEGVKIGALGIKCFRPWPLDEVRAALGGASRVIVLEKAFAVGLGGVLGQNVRLALSGLPADVHDVVAGLGGRAITKQSLHTLFADVLAGHVPPDRLTFLDLDWQLVAREVERTRATRRSGPHAENILRDVGAVAARAH
jgi:pyruvate/2-oxoacid:ferredoxin oxidoreductase alpha subunit